MTDLQLALLALGAIIIAAVILFNWLQESRIRRETVRRFDGPIKDVLMVDDDDQDSHPAPSIKPTAETPPQPEVSITQSVEIREEVTFHFSEEDREPTINFDKLRTESPTNVTEQTGAYAVEEDEEPHIAPVVVNESEPAAPVIEQPVVTEPAVHVVEVPLDALPPNVDEEIDSVAVIILSTPRKGEQLREAMLPLPQPDKHSQWMGLTASGLWRNITKDMEQTLFTRIVGSLQLADRAGPISSGVLADFRRKAEESATRLLAQLEWRGAANPQRYAQELDQFCIEVDVMVSLHLVAEQSHPFAGTKLRGLAEASGLTLLDDGAFHYVNDSNETLFTLINQNVPFTTDALRSGNFQSVSLQIDVTRVNNCPAAFDTMVAIARNMAQGLEARLVDDNQRVLGDMEIGKIRQQLQKIYSSMMAHNIIPGSPTALRLFS